MRTVRQQRGVAAEDIAAGYLGRCGWRLMARNVKVERDEIDLVAVDPGPPIELVCVEVRSARSSQFGAPEERVDKRKVANLYRAARAFIKSDVAGQLEFGRMAVRVDLVVVDLRAARPQIRHLRRLEAA